MEVISLRKKLPRLFPNSNFTDWELGTRLAKIKLMRILLTLLFLMAQSLQTEAAPQSSLQIPEVKIVEEYKFNDSYRQFYTEELIHELSQYRYIFVRNLNINVKDLVLKEEGLYHLPFVIDVRWLRTTFFQEGTLIARGYIILSQEALDSLLFNGFTDSQSIEQYARLALFKTDEEVIAWLNKSVKPALFYVLKNELSKSLTSEIPRKTLL